MPCCTVLLSLTGSALPSALLLLSRVFFASPHIPFGLTPRHCSVVLFYSPPFLVALLSFSRTSVLFGFTVWLPLSPRFLSFALPSTVSVIANLCLHFPSTVLLARLAFFPFSVLLQLAFSPDAVPFWLLSPRFSFAGPFAPLPALTTPPLALHCAFNCLFGMPRFSRRWSLLPFEQWRPAYVLSCAFSSAPHAPPVPPHVGRRPFHSITPPRACHFARARFTPSLTVAASPATRVPPRPASLPYCRFRLVWLLLGSRLPSSPLSLGGFPSWSRSFLLSLFSPSPRLTPSFSRLVVLRMRLFV